MLLKYYFENGTKIFGRCKNTFPSGHNLRNEKRKTFFQKCFEEEE